MVMLGGGVLGARWWAGRWIDFDDALALIGDTAEAGSDMDEDSDNWGDGADMDDPYATTDDEGDTPLR